jgi:hypothetical protein
MAQPMIAWGTNRDMFLVTFERSSRMPMPAGWSPTIQAPTTGIGVVEAGERVEGLADVAFLAVALVEDGGPAAGVDQLDVGALAGEQRLADIGIAEVRRPGVVLEEGRQQVRVALVALPEQRQQALVGHHRLPGRLQEHGPGAFRCAA